jgi:hypothetical protein
MKEKLRLKHLKLCAGIFWICLMQIVASAQSGGNYQITQAVIASGGEKSVSANLNIEGTIGQALAGANSSSGQFSLSSGFWSQPPLAPTVATVSLSGKITLSEGNLMRRVQILLQNLSTGVIRNAIPNQYGYYRFDELEIGTYLITTQSRFYQFTPSSLLLEIIEDREEVNFSGLRIFEN